MQSMTVQRGGKLNRLERDLPEGLVVDASWLTEHGYSTALRTQYLKRGWLKRPARAVYMRPRGELSWEQVVISLQALLRKGLVVGGRTALEFQGYGHFVSRSVSTVHLYGLARPPSWLSGLHLGVDFRYHNSSPLFGADLEGLRLPTLRDRVEPAGEDAGLQHAGLRVVAWGQWEWPLVLSSPERAVLELMDALPKGETFEHVDVVMEGLSDLSPRRMQRLLERCERVKVKRLFFFFADRHKHAWLKRLDKSSVDLGSGKRVLATNGRLDPTYQITVPTELGQEP